MRPPESWRKGNILVGLLRRRLVEEAGRADQLAQRFAEFEPQHVNELVELITLVERHREDVNALLVYLDRVLAEVRE